VEIGPRVPGAARLQLADGIPLLRPEEQVFTAMLEGWRHQQLARNLALATIAARERAARAFTAHADAFPWLWTAAMLDEWLGDLRAVRGLRRSTLRGYQEAIRMLCLSLTDPAYGWTGECETRFGTHPVQVVHEWNTAVHVRQAEGDPIKSSCAGSRCCWSGSSRPPPATPGTASARPARTARRHVRRPGRYLPATHRAHHRPARRPRQARCRRTQEDHRTRPATSNVLTSTNTTAWTHACPGDFRRPRRSNPRFRVQHQHQLRKPGAGEGAKADHVDTLDLFHTMEAYFTWYPTEHPRAPPPRRARTR
jgi:hypothetical protein